MMQMIVETEDERYEGIQFAPALGMAMAEKIGIPKEIDRQLLGPKNIARKLSAGMACKAMLGTMFTEEGRKPLYRIERCYSTAPNDLLFGRGVTASTLQDRNLRAILDDVFQIDMDDVHWRMSERACSMYDLNNDVYRVDHTNDPYYGIGYRTREAKRLEESTSGKAAAVPEYGGNSKIKRNDLLQKNIMAISNDHGVMMLAKPFDGNTSDTEMNHEALDFLAGRINMRDAIVVADCKLADANLVGKMHRMGIGFITKIPHSFNDCALDRFKASALSGRMDPSARRRGAEFYETSEPVVIDDGTAIDTRFLVYRLEGASREAEAFLRGRGFERAIAKVKSLKSRKFFCEDDAAKDVAKMLEDLAPAYWFEADYAIDRNLVRSDPDGPHWRIRPSDVVMDDDGVREVAEEFSLQVLMTNIPLRNVDSNCPRRGLSSDGLLSMYIDQFTIEHDFKLMKSGCGVNRMFIHTPARQDAVVFLSGLSTMVASVIDAVLEETAVDKHHDITTKHITDFMTNAIVKYYRDEHRMVFAGYEGVAAEAMDILERLELKPESLLGC